MNKLRIVMLHVSAIDYGTHFVVINRKGRHSSRLKRSDTGTISDSELSRIKRRIRWARAIKRMMSGLQSDIRRKHVDPWELKIKTWQKSIWLRQRDSQRTKHSSRFFTTESRPNWDRACECMLRQYYNRVVRKQRHLSDPWQLWAETVSQNHNRKEQHRGQGSDL